VIERRGGSTTRARRVFARRSWAATVRHDNVLAAAARVALVVRRALLILVAITVLGTLVFAALSIK
jgi:hypothetical protein